jgi:hypothetical protein
MKYRQFGGSANYRQNNRVPAAWEESVYSRCTLIEDNGVLAEPEDEELPHESQTKKLYIKALSCGKIYSFVGQCHHNRKNS